MESNGTRFGQNIGCFDFLLFLWGDVSEYLLEKEALKDSQIEEHCSENR